MHTIKYFTLPSARLVLGRLFAISRVYSFWDVMLMPDSTADASRFLGAQAVGGRS